MSEWYANQSKSKSDVRTALNKLLEESRFKRVRRQNLVDLKLPELRET